MKASVRDALIYASFGIITALILFGVKKCNDNAKEKAKPDIAKIMSARADSLNNVVKTYEIDNGNLQHGLTMANDSIGVLNDSIDVLNDSVVVLNTKNGILTVANDDLKRENSGLKREKDSIVAELDDCKASKQSVKKTPVKKKPVVVSEPSKEPAKPQTNKPMQIIQKPCEPVIIKQEPKSDNTGSTTVNVNTPGNTVNISNGGIINNFYGDCDTTEQAVQEQVKREFKKATVVGYAVGDMSVPCR